MALTALPMSTISYNSVEFLTIKLTAMLDSGKLDDFRFIRHIGEDGDKDHVHLWVRPSKRLDFKALSDDLREVDLSNPGKTLGVLPWRKSDADNWLMYILHDPDYLAIHSKANDEPTHKIEYSLQDVYTPYPEQLERDFRRAVSLRQTDAQRVIQALQRGMSVVDIMYTIQMNPTQIQAIARAYQEAVYSARRHWDDEKPQRDKNTPLQVDLGALCSESGLGYEQLPIQWEEKK